MLAMSKSKETPEVYFARHRDHIDDSFLTLFDFDDDPEEREWTTPVVWSWVSQYEMGFGEMRKLQ